MLRHALITLLLLPAALAGCIGGDDLDDNTLTDTLAPAPGLEGLAILDTPRTTFTELLCDGGCLREMTTLESGPANEVMVAMDYANPNVLIAGSKDYHADDPTCVVTSVYASTDGGRTWADGYPRERTGVLGGPSTDRCESDPVVAFDGRGNALLMTLTLADGLWTYRSSDNGATWSEVAMAFEGFNDKNWAASDYRINRIYSITRATCDGGEAVTVTDDAGDTWAGPYCFKGMDFGQIDVGPEGQVYAIGIAAPGYDGIVFQKSLDGGQNWTEPVRIADLTAFGTLPGMDGHLYRTPALPDMAVALGTGAIYTAWHDRAAPTERQNVYFSASFDEGETWSEPMIVADDSSPLGADQFIPAVAASPAGDAHVIFFDARNDPTGTGQVLDVYYTHSPDGVTFEPNIRLTELPFVPYLSRHQQQPFFIGDYIGLAASNSEAVAVFPVTYDGRAEIAAAIVGGEPVV